MPVYSATIAGRKKPLLVRADTAAKAKDLIVTLDALTGEEMADAMERGEKVWKPGDPMPADDVSTEIPKPIDPPAGDNAGDPKPETKGGAVKA